MQKLNSEPLVSNLSFKAVPESISLWGAFLFALSLVLFLQVFLSLNRIRFSSLYPNPQVGFWVLGFDLVGFILDGIWLAQVSLKFSKREKVIVVSIAEVAASK